MFKYAIVKMRNNINNDNNIIYAYSSMSISNLHDNQWLQLAPHKVIGRKNMFEVVIGRKKVSRALQKLYPG